jgi:hypothetical protein
LDILKDKIIEDHENFQTITDLISKIDLFDLKNSLATKIINLSNEMRVESLYQVDSNKI